MRNALTRFDPVGKYLIKAREMMEREEMQVKMRWEQIQNESDFQDTNGIENDDPSKMREYEKATAKQIEDENDEIEYRGYPISIIPVGERVANRKIENFISSYYILDSPGRATNDNSIKVYHGDPDEMIMWVKRLPRSEFIYQLPETKNLKRQKKALDYLLNSPRPEYYPLLSLVESKDFVWWQDFDTDISIEWEILNDEERKGTDAQRNFVKIALPTKESGTPDFAILEGPPGSGKTTAICELIVQAIRRGMKVLLCASTHIAVDNVLERLHDHDEIIAVRISFSEYNVKKPMRKYTLQRRKRTEKENIRSFLKSLGNKRNDAQNFLLRSLEGDDSDNVITNIVLESANLICGTAIGFLQHPDIDANQPPRPIFDLMILDEASKTTFQEFLVPALYAKRWILSGDIRQLSPYVEEKEVEGNLDYLLRDESGKDGDLCLKSFQAAQPMRQLRKQMRRELKTKKMRKGMGSRIGNLLFICDKEDPIFGKCEQQCSSMGLETIAITQDSYEDQLVNYEFLGANVFIVDPSALAHIEPYLPPDIQVYHGLNPAGFNLFTRRVSYWRSYNQITKSKHSTIQEIIDTYEPSSWAYEMTWRITRQYELRRSEKEQLPITQDIERLIPVWYDEAEKNRFRNELDNIKRIALPSCLELLQEGVSKTLKDIRREKNSGYAVDYALATGLPDEVFEARHVLLEYQHRMHPDISRFPRKFIYTDNRSKQPVPLRDPPNILTEREWDYPHFQQRCWWSHIRQLPPWKIKFQQNSKYSKNDLQDRNNENHDEAQEMMKDLSNFRDWAKQNPKKQWDSSAKKEWTVAILTFYIAQERVLSKKLRSFFNKPLNTRNFNDSEHNLKVEVCTVDRFQGHEADVVFLSFVRSGFGVGFLNSIHRLNVALTRARYLLVIYGDQRSFKKAYGTKHDSDVLYNLALETPSNISLGEYV